MDDTSRMYATESFMSVSRLTRNRMVIDQSMCVRDTEHKHQERPREAHAMRPERETSQTVQCQSNVHVN